MVKTLIEILLERSKTDNKGVTFIEGGDLEETLSYKALYNNALHVLSFLRARGLNPKDELVFQIDDNKTFIVVFWACILGGIIPVPLTLGKNDDHRKKLYNVWDVLINPYLIISQDNLNKLKKYGEVAGNKKFFDSFHEKFLFVEDIYNTKKEGDIFCAKENDIAYIQFSSGSTGDPKGVILTHRNLIANLRAISEASLYNEKDSKLSWMPLTHDMGLIGFHLCPLFCGMDHFLLPTSLFIRRPALWPEKASQHKATILCSPNFGYKYLLNQYNPANDYDWDLSNVRMIYNGAEPVSEKICHEFLDTFENYGLKKEAMYPVYGLAEASLAVSFSKLDEEVLSLSIDRDKTGLGETVIINEKGKNSISFVNVGNSIPYCSLRVADDTNNVCNEHVIGHIQIKGDNVTSGYYNNPVATKKVLTGDGWLDTGDLGFLHNTCLYVTGRSKDIIFIHGQNYYPHDIETSLEVIENIELGKVVVAGYTSDKTGEEEVVVFVLFKGKTEKFIGIRNKVKVHINSTFGFVPNNIIPVREIPKTTSGKIQRFKLVENLVQGRYSEIINEIECLVASDKSQQEFVNPANEIEKRLSGIWSGILSHEDFGITQKFFEVGGNSLKAARVLSAIHKEFQVELDYKILFEKQTIQEIAEEIRQQEVTGYEPIPHVKKQESYALSSAQRRLYYLWKVEKTSVAYNIPLAFTIKGRLDVAKLEQAINRLIERHEILRSSFYGLNGEPRQKFVDEVSFNLTVAPIEFQKCSEELNRRVRPFDLYQCPLFRIDLLSLPADHYILFLDFHHIISDGVSISLFLDELFRIYHGGILPKAEVQYKDYIGWENKRLASESFKTQESFWLQQFNDDIPVLNFPTDFPRPSLMDYHGEKLGFSIDKALREKLIKLAKQENTSLFALLLAVYNVLLSKYTGQEDFVVGVPVAGRNHEQLQSLQGMFVNNLAMRNFPKGDMTFQKFLSQVQNNSLQVFNNKEYPFEDLVRQIGQKRDISRNTLFDTMFVFQNMGFPKISRESLTVEQFFFNPGFSKYDISLEVFDEDGSLDYFVEYSTSLFEKDTILRFVTCFENLLNNIVETPGARISDLSILSEGEFDRLVREENETNIEYSKGKVIHQLFEEQALKHPDEIAVIIGNRSNELQATSHEPQAISQKLQEEKTGDRREEMEGPGSSLPVFGYLKKLTYKELNDRSSQLANILRKTGIAPNIPVAIVLDRSPELIMAILGILKAGGCYLPIDKDLPEERIKYILEDSRASLLITASSHKLLAAGSQSQASSLQLVANSLQLEVIEIDDNKIYSTEPETITNINTPNNLAYIIYTSGTTGNPKGVMVGHQSLVNYVSFASRTYVKGEQCSFPLYTSISFDLTVTSVFVPLITGNTIVTYPDNEKSLPLEDVIEDNQIRAIKATPSHLKMLKENRKLRDVGFKSQIKRFIVGGEALTSQLAKEIYCLFGEKVEIYNEYGPTEATVGCMIYEFDAEKDKRLTVPIGVPVDNSQVFLLDRYMNPVPVGVVGEIYISGDCLSGGYFFNPQLTEEKFIQNPFMPGQKMYKTGDLGKRLPDGNIEFIGRVDQQVKINGYRVEIEEVEQQILKCTGVSETVVVCKGESLCAYVVLDGDKGSGLQATSQKPQENLMSEIKQHLSIHLPHYMHPKHIIAIDAIPLTKNGKINLGILPEPNHHENVKEEATNDIQKVILSVWRDVLNESKIGITDNFFELGGDSIKAVQIASRLYDKNIAVNVKDILTYQTIEQFCLYAEFTETTKKYEQGIVEGEIGLNPIQKWFFEENFPNPHFYNQSVLLEFKEPINKETLCQAFKILIGHHDGLRMNYDPEKEVMFYNNSYLGEEFVIEEYIFEPQASSHELQEVSDGHFKAIHSKHPVSNIEDICQKIRNSFNIENTLLIKTAIIHEQDKGLLFITAHHLIIDGISWRVILEDLYTVYSSLKRGKEIKLSQKTASLIDWGNRLLEYANSDELQSQVEYWSEIENSVSLPTNEVCLAKDRKQGAFRLDEEETRFLLTEANKAYNTNVEILLVTALVKTLREWKNYDDVVIEMESHGRHFEDIDVARTTGWLTSMFPVRFKLEQEIIGEQIKYVKEQIRNIPEKGMGYGVLKYINKALKGKAGLKTRFNYLGQFGSELSNDLFVYQQEVKDAETDGKNPVTAWMEVNAMVVGNELAVDVSSLEEPNGFIKSFQKNLRYILEHLKEEQDIHFTPSDFDAVDLDEEDLRVLFG